MWRVTSNPFSPSSYLMAHQYPNARPGLNHSSVFADVLQKVDSVLIPFDEPEKKIHKAVALNATMKNGLTLDSLLSEQAQQQLKQLVERKAGVRYSALQEAPPLAVAQFIIPKLNGADQNQTYADIAWRKWQETYRPATGVLSKADQRKSYQQVDYSRQAQYLADLLNQQKSTTKALYQMARAYRSPDYRALQKACQQAYPFLTDLEGRLVKPQTEKWLTAIQEHTGSNQILAIVGAHHLHGEDGLLKRLKAVGYQIEPYEYQVLDQKENVGGSQ